MSLANKYRPQTFDEMIWQEHIIDILKAQMQSRDVVHHNYLLFWPRWTWKTTSARLIAKALNCLDLQNWNPCNHCSNCELINNWTSLDYVEIDAASHTSVDNIREEIIEKSLYPPTALRKKVYVIDEVHMLSKSAFNALLKTIEEPKWNVCFILATTEIHKVPDTIISRCQVFNYRKVPNKAMESHLEKICKKENLSYTPSALEIIANISEGCVRDAVKYVDQVSILWDLNDENVSRFLWVAWEALIRDFLLLIKDKNRENVFSKIDMIEQQGIDLSQFAKQALWYIDQHLLEDTDFYLKCSEIFWEVVSLLKWYPYPLIAYKIAVNKYFEVDDAGTVLKVEKENKNIPVANTTNAVKSSWVSDKSLLVENKEESNHLDEKFVSVEDNIWAKRNDTKAVSVEDNSEIVSSDPISSNAWETDFSVLWSNVLKWMNKPTAQINLKDQAIIENIEWWMVDITVITPLAKMLLTNEENKKLVEQLLSKELWENISINITFIKKEEYLAKKMWL